MGDIKEEGGLWPNEQAWRARAEHAQCWVTLGRSTNWCSDVIFIKSAPGYCVCFLGLL